MPLTFPVIAFDDITPTFGRLAATTARLEAHMGMYTEFYISTELAPGTPPEVIAILDYMRGGGDDPRPPLPHHPLFACGRWEHVLTGQGSFYFNRPAGAPPAGLSRSSVNGSWYLNSAADLQNYDGEIAKFLDWITPHLTADGFVGFHRYEERESPTLVYRVAGVLVEFDVPDVGLHNVPGELATRRLKLVTPPLAAKKWAAATVVDGEIVAERRAIGGKP